MQNCVSFTGEVGGESAEPFTDGCERYQAWCRSGWTLVTLA